LRFSFHFRKRSRVITGTDQANAGQIFFPARLCTASIKRRPTVRFCTAGSTVIGPTPPIAFRSSRKMLPTTLLHCGQSHLNRSTSQPLNFLFQLVSSLDFQLSKSDEQNFASANRDRRHDPTSFTGDRSCSLGVSSANGRCRPQPPSAHVKARPCL